MAQSVWSGSLGSGAVVDLRVVEEMRVLTVCTTSAVYSIPLQDLNQEAENLLEKIQGRKQELSVQVTANYARARYWKKSWWIVDDRGCLTTCDAVQSSPRFGSKSLHSSSKQVASIQAIEFLGRSPVLGGVNGDILFCNENLSYKPPRESGSQGSVMMIVSVSEYCFLSIHSTGQIVSWIHHDGV